jgi:hypothetical protein
MHEGVNNGFHEKVFPPLHVLEVVVEELVKKLVKKTCKQKIRPKSLEYSAVCKSAFAIRCRERKKSLGMQDTYTLPYFAIRCREP